MTLWTEVWRRDGHGAGWGTDVSHVGKRHARERAVERLQELSRRGQIARVVGPDGRTVVRHD